MSQRIHAVIEAMRAAHPVAPGVVATLSRATSRPFPKPTSVRIAVEVINHLGDEVMKVFRVK